MIRSERQALQQIHDLVKKVKNTMPEDYSYRYYGNSDPLATRLGIEVKEILDLRDDGIYVPGSPPRISLKPIIGVERLNFTYFHEIMHHLIKNDDDLYSFIHENAFGDNFNFLLEAYCNIGAAEFLIPLNYVAKIIKQEGFSIKLVKLLDESSNASIIAATLQLARGAPHDCRIVICEYGLVDGYADSRQHRIWGGITSPIKNLFVRYSANSPATGGKYRIGRNVIIPADHVISRAYHNQSYETGQDIIPFRNTRKWKCACEAYYYKDRVYAVFNNKQPPQYKDQGLLFDLDDYTNVG